MTTHPITVMQALSDPDADGGVTNPYTSLLVRGIRDDGRVGLSFFRWKGMLTDRFDVLHVHWPEVFVAHPRRLGRVAKSAALLVFLLRIRLQRKAIVRTVHNLRPHEAVGAVEGFALRRLDRMTNRWIVLNESTETPDAAATQLIRHGHYRDWYPLPEPGSSVPGRVLAFGLIRAYKGMDELVRAFRETEDPALSLVVAGKPDSRATVDALSALAEGDPRIALDLRFIPDADLAAQIAQASLVALPYKEVHNSGVALLALSLNRPVLVRDTPSTRLLAAEFGEQWIILFTGALTAETIAGAVRRTAETPRPEQVDMRSRDWGALGRATVDVFLDAVGRPRSDSAVVEG